LQYDAAHLAINCGKKFHVYIDKSGGGISNFNCQISSAFLVNYSIFFECVFAKFGCS